MVYNVPGRTSCNLSAETTLRLATDFPGVVVAVKEASGDLNQIMTILREKPDDFLVVSGDDALALPLIACGAAGVVSVIGNAYPELFSRMVREALEGNLAEAQLIASPVSPHDPVGLQGRKPDGGESGHGPEGLDRE
ncbi:MAG: dihydrodipicolinate synthase family protein [Bacteroidales bacterium]